MLCNQDFWNFLALFRWLIKKNFQHFLCQNSPKIGIKCHNLLDLDTPPPFLPKIPNCFVTKKCSKLLDRLGAPPSLSLWKIPKLQLHFVQGLSLFCKIARLPNLKKSRIQEILNLLTAADRSAATIFILSIFWGSSYLFWRWSKFAFLEGVQNFFFLGGGAMRGLKNNGRLLFSPWDLLCSAKFYLVVNALLSGQKICLDNFFVRIVNALGFLS